jgi:hypothetical protein
MQPSLSIRGRCRRSAESVVHPQLSLSIRASHCRATNSGNDPDLSPRHRWMHENVAGSTDRLKKFAERSASFAPDVGNLRQPFGHRGNLLRSAAHWGDPSEIFLRSAADRRLQQKCPGLQSAAEKILS